MLHKRWAYRFAGGQDCALCASVFPFMAIVFLLRLSAPIPSVADVGRSGGSMKEQPTKQARPLIRAGHQQDSSPRRAHVSLWSHQVAGLDSFLQHHPSAKRVVLRNVLVQPPDTQSLDTSLIRSRIARVLHFSTLSPLEASMLRDYQLYGTFYDPPSKDMSELQVPLSDITKVLTTIF